MQSAGYAIAAAEPSSLILAATNWVRMHWTSCCWNFALSAARQLRLLLPVTRRNNLCCLRAIPSAWVYWPREARIFTDSGRVISTWAGCRNYLLIARPYGTVSYTHLRAHETASSL